jgi:hypothetical protein
MLIFCYFAQPLPFTTLLLSSAQANPLTLPITIHSTYATFIVHPASISSSLQPNPHSFYYF